MGVRLDYKLLIFVGLCALIFSPKSEAFHSPLSLKHSEFHRVSAAQHPLQNPCGASYRIRSSLSMKVDSKPQTMKKSEFLNEVAQKSGVTKTEADKILKAILQVILEEVANRKQINIPGFGRFQSRERKARNQVNPRTGEVMKLEATYSPAFTAAQAFKEKVKSAFAGSSTKTSSSAVPTKVTGAVEAKASKVVETEVSGAIETNVSEVEPVLKFSKPKKIQEQPALALKNPKTTTKTKETVEASFLQQKAIAAPTFIARPLYCAPRVATALPAPVKTPLEPLTKAIAAPTFIARPLYCAPRVATALPAPVKTPLEPLTTEVFSPDHVCQPKSGVKAKPVTAQIVSTATESKNPANVEAPSQTTFKVEPVKKADFISLLSNRVDVSASEADKIFLAMLEVITDEVASGKKVNYAGFGSFEPRQRKARTMRNFQTKETMKLEATQAPTFVASAAFKRKVQSSFESMQTSSTENKVKDDSTTKKSENDKKVKVERREVYTDENSAQRFFEEFDYLTLFVRTIFFSLSVTAKLAEFGLTASGFAFGAALNFLLKAWLTSNSTTTEEESKPKEKPDSAVRPVYQPVGVASTSSTSSNVTADIVVTSNQELANQIFFTTVDILTFFGKAVVETTKELANQPPPSKQPEDSQSWLSLISGFKLPFFPQAPPVNNSTEPVSDQAVEVLSPKVEIVEEETPKTDSSQEPATGYLKSNNASPKQVQQEDRFVTSEKESKSFGEISSFDELVSVLKVELASKGQAFAPANIGMKNKAPTSTFARKETVSDQAVEAVSPKLEIVEEETPKTDSSKAMPWEGILKALNLQNKTTPAPQNSNKISVPGKDLEEETSQKAEAKAQSPTKSQQWQSLLQGINFPDKKH